ncbi:zinc finger C-x8-C-x5-C-x3-H type, putative [Plasmodium malariae]|uniref:Zinc finger C-x8-C-x5-C-x3-H type, putative n=1 Tax=Plasmodium malariae TaxID=5858 RepID=A0A1A8WWD3_PLAMA|nr:zinc finger C-x8-C-x5-C-x3-H type, putative [Plasmodium malariae]
MSILPEIKYQFTKTKICKHFLENKCTNRDNCNYAHVIEELRPLPNLENTKLCKSVKKNIACTNPDCKYAHEIENLHPSTDLATYKTTLCYFWKKKKCMNQSKCRFAHGIQEIRPLKIGKEEKIEVINDKRNDAVSEKINDPLNGKRNDAVNAKKKLLLPKNNDINISLQEHQTIRQNEQMVEDIYGEVNEKPQKDVNIRDVLSNLIILENIPIIQSDFATFNDDFLNFYQNMSLNLNSFSISSERKYSNSFLKKEFDQTHCADIFHPDVDMFNVDFLMQDSVKENCTRNNDISYGANRAVIMDATNNRRNNDSNADLYLAIDTPTEQAPTDDDYFNNIYKSIKKELSKNFENIYSY